MNIEGRYSQTLIEISNDSKYQIEKQIDNISIYLKERRLTIINLLYSMKRITQNEMIMDLAFQYCNRNKKFKVILNRMNKA